MKTKLFTLPEYVKFLSNQYCEEEQKRDLVTSGFKMVNHFFSASSAIFFILDYRTGKFEYMSTNFTEVFKTHYNPLMEGGIEYFNHIQHPNDMRIFINDIFKNRLSFMKSLPQNDHENYCYSNNFRLIDQNKKYHHFLRQFVNSKTDANGMPLIATGVCIDITPYKTDTKMVDSIYKFDGKNGLNEIHTNFYYPNDDGGLTRREAEILKYILDGLTSEKIADKLFLSLHTVKPHRKNMLMKTNSKNTGELLRYAIQNGIV